MARAEGFTLNDLFDDEFEKLQAMLLPSAEAAAAAAVAAATAARAAAAATATAHVVTSRQGRGEGAGPAQRFGQRRRLMAAGAGLLTASLIPSPQAALLAREGDPSSGGSASGGGSSASGGGTSDGGVGGTTTTSSSSRPAKGKAFFQVPDPKNTTPAPPWGLSLPLGQGFPPCPLPPPVMVSPTTQAPRPSEVIEPLLLWQQHSGARLLHPSEEPPRHHMTRSPDESTDLGGGNSDETSFGTCPPAALFQHVPARVGWSSKGAAARRPVAVGTWPFWPCSPVAPGNRQPLTATVLPDGPRSSRTIAEVIEEASNVIPPQNLPRAAETAAASAVATSAATRADEASAATAKRRRKKTSKKKRKEPRWTAQEDPMGRGSKLTTPRPRSTSDRKGTSRGGARPGRRTSSKPLSTATSKKGNLSSATSPSSPRPQRRGASVFRWKDHPEVNQSILNAMERHYRAGTQTSYKEIIDEDWDFWSGIGLTNPDTLGRHLRDIRCGQKNDQTGVLDAAALTRLWGILKTKRVRETLAAEDGEDAESDDAGHRARRPRRRAGSGTKRQRRFN